MKNTQSLTQRAGLLLMKARKLLSNPARWVKGSYKKEFTRRMVPIEDHVSWENSALKALMSDDEAKLEYEEKVCILGSLGVHSRSAYLALEDDDPRKIAADWVGEELEPGGDTESGQTIPSFNDNAATKHEDVLMVMDQALEINAPEVLAEAEEI